MKSRRPVEGKVPGGGEAIVLRMKWLRTIAITALQLGSTTFACEILIDDVTENRGDFISAGTYRASGYVQIGSSKWQVYKVTYSDGASFEVYYVNEGMYSYTFQGNWLEVSAFPLF